MLNIEGNGLGGSDFFLPTIAMRIGVGNQGGVGFWLEGDGCGSSGEKNAARACSGQWEGMEEAAQTGKSCVPVRVRPVQGLRWRALPAWGAGAGGQLGEGGSLAASSGEDLLLSLGLGRGAGP